MAQHDPLNLKVHHKNPKSGKIERVTPYRLHIEGRVRFYEVPRGSGAFFYENGEPVPANLAPKLTPVAVYMTEDELRAQHNKVVSDLSGENEALKAKLAALENSKSQTKVVINKSAD